MRHGNIVYQPSVRTEGFFCKTLTDDTKGDTVITKRGIYYATADFAQMVKNNSFRQHITDEKYFPLQELEMEKQIEEEQQGKEQRHKCKCCGFYTLVGTEEDITWDICPVCFWENDVFGNDPNTYSGANHETLAQGRENYKKFAACDLQSVKSVRLPLPQELPENNE